MKASGLNPVDWKYCSWFDQRCIGIDGCGIVHELGTEVNKDTFKVGETVVYFHGPLIRLDQGTFGEYYVIDNSYVSIVPKSLLNKF